MTIPLQFWLIATEQYGIFIVLVPVWMFLMLPSAMTVLGQTEGFLKAAGTLHWGVMSTVYSLGHMAYLLVLPKETGGIAEGAALVVTGILFLTGSITNLGYWMLETFPALAEFERFDEVAEAGRRDVAGQSPDENGAVGAGLKGFLSRRYG